MERVQAEELLDQDGWSAEEVECALGAIRRVNLLYGGNLTHKRLFRRVCARTNIKQLHILEVAAGHADVLQAAARELQQRGVKPQVSLLDRCATHLPGEGDWDPQLPRPALLTGDALDLPLENDSVDVVSCCLFLHHLDAADARKFLREALRVARVGVLINDLERTRRNYTLSRLQTLLDPSWISRHDGPASVRQSYSFRELETMLRETGSEYDLRRGWLFRLGAILWKEPAK